MILIFRVVTSERSLLPTFHVSCCWIFVSRLFWLVVLFMDPDGRAPKKNTSSGNKVLPQDTTHLLQRPCYQRGSLCQDPAGDWTIQRPPDHHKEMQTAVVWSCCPFIMSGQIHLARHCERGKKTRQTKEEVGRQHQGLDLSGVRQVPEGSGQQKNGGNWLWNHLLCLNDPRCQAIGEDEGVKVKVWRWRCEGEGVKVKVWRWRCEDEGVKVKVWRWRCEGEGVKVKVWRWRGEGEGVKVKVLNEPSDHSHGIFTRWGYHGKQERKWGLGADDNNNKKDSTRCRYFLHTPVTPCKLPEMLHSATFCN